MLLAARCRVLQPVAPVGVGLARRSLSTLLFREDELEESFQLGSGNGGQKVNKTSNCVRLKHLPTGIEVRCQATRSLTTNRALARRVLQERLDEHINGANSKKAKARERVRKQKAKARKRSAEKYGATKPSEPPVADPTLAPER